MSASHLPDHIEPQIDDLEISKEQINDYNDQQSDGQTSQTNELNHHIEKPNDLNSVNSDNEKTKPSMFEEEVVGKLFIGGVAFQTTEDGLRYYFEKFGELVDYALMKDRRTGAPRGFGFVKYKDPSAIDKVLAQEHSLDGRVLDVKRAVPRDKAPLPASQTEKVYESKKIFVGGLPPSVTETEFKDYFSKFGKVTESIIMLDRASNASRGFGFITFENESSIDQVLSRTDHEINGKFLEIKRAEPKEMSAHNRMKNRPPDQSDYYDESYDDGSQYDYYPMQPNYSSRQGYSNRGNMRKNENNQKLSTNYHHHSRSNVKDRNYNYDPYDVPNSRRYNRYESSSPRTTQYPPMNTQPYPPNAPRSRSSYYYPENYGNYSQDPTYSATGYGAYRGQHTSQGRIDRNFRPY